MSTDYYTGKEIPFNQLLPRLAPFGIIKSPTAVDKGDGAMNLMTANGEASLWATRAPNGMLSYLTRYAGQRPYLIFCAISDAFDTNIWCGEQGPPEIVTRPERGLRAQCRAEGLKIDPAKVEVCCVKRYVSDPYGFWDDCLKPKGFRSAIQRQYFARAHGSDFWVCFDDLPEATRNALRDRLMDPKDPCGPEPGRVVPESEPADPLDPCDPFPSRPVPEAHKPKPLDLSFVDLPEPEPTVTIDQVRDIMREVATRPDLGRKVGLQILDDFGGRATYLAEVKPDKYEAVYDAARAKLDERPVADSLDSLDPC
jgi:hypothetical protein